jgi:hypothetical protein
LPPRLRTSNTEPQSVAAAATIRASRATLGLLFTIPNENHEKIHAAWLLLDPRRCSKHLLDDSPNAACGSHPVSLSLPGISELLEESRHSIFPHRTCRKQACCRTLIAPGHVTNTSGHRKLHPIGESLQTSITGSPTELSGTTKPRGKRVGATLGPDCKLNSRRILDPTTPRDRSIDG